MSLLEGDIMSDSLKAVHEKRRVEYEELCREMGVEPRGADILGDHWRELIAKKEKCRCKRREGLRSTHCPHHGTCNCCHGARCPSHDEPEQFVQVSEGYLW